jgi:CBS-domain-containing membrane protein
VHVIADQGVDEAALMMEERQIRRLPVLGRDQRLVGIISLGDIALSSNPAFSGMALRDVSEPASPTARQRRLAQQSTPTRMAMEREEKTSERRRPANRKTRRAAGPRKKNSRKSTQSRTRTRRRASRSRG